VRIGHGFDVHRLVGGRKLVLGGVEIPFDKGLEGHSDADVLTHAVMDAILGALGQNDIGTHFPDTDPAYKDISSLILLDKVVEIMRMCEYRLGNLDVLLHADKPKVKKYIPQMRVNLTRAFDCNENQINVKATTWEGLGFAGVGDGMAASAVCMLYPDSQVKRKRTTESDAAGLFDDQPAQPKKKTPLKGKRDVDLKKKDTWVANIDGASRGNPGPSAIGVIIRDPGGLILAEISESIGEATNNVAEYKALIRALEEFKLLKAEKVIVRTDSQLLARQIDGTYKVKNPGLQELYGRAMGLIVGFKSFDVEHITRKENQEADRLATEAL
jgi:2-C-methyl-D-erythritol 2,4-cyclodiphosphate synthase